MLMVAEVQKTKRIPLNIDEESLFGIDKLNIHRSDIPAVTHVDYSARIQTVHKETNPRYYELLRQFEEKTGCAVLVNTSFNVRGEPIVCTPEDAYRCFMATNMDVLVIENFVLRKSDQPDAQEIDVDAYFLEYDDERSGDFAPLRFFSPDKTLVLGLVTSKFAELEDPFKVDQIDELETTEITTDTYMEYNEQYRYFLIPALALLVLEVMLLGSRFRKLP